jgi:hypothetical protein
VEKVENMDFKCTKCAEIFGRVGNFVGHYRHHHTNYDALFDEEMGRLRKCRGMTQFQRKIMAKQTVRLFIEEEIENQIKAIEMARDVVRDKEAQEAKAKEAKA